MIPPRLIATDLDGTLLRDDGTVSERTATALRDAAAAGIEVVFVTARPPRWLEPLSEHVAGHGVVICANGAAVVDVATREVLAEHGMTAELVATIVGRVRAAWSDAAFATESAAGFAHERGFSSIHEVPVGSPVADRIEDVLPESSFKLLVRSPSRPLGTFFEDLAAVVGDLAIVADSGASGLGEISGQGVTKSATLARWAADRGISASEVWAMGDAPNDLSMLTWAGASFAVANAHPSVLAAATHRCGSNVADGPADVLDLAIARRGAGAPSAPTR
ncbi:HAD-IIB family hydrolase [Cellulomonas sp. URHD0024]|uniref:HAD-IIB family hydrolase n=1 Tax=Cellulomonas sp. URHD0024 TaxID=1302620 RepID=UPI00042042D5|nr:HAD-IIB family hydrolase [Cellulomonas sp. URHD0024]